MTVPKREHRCAMHLGAAMVAAMALTGQGCGATYENATKDDLRLMSAKLSPVATEPEPHARLDGTLQGYLAHALKHSPEIRASFERWRAATLRIAKARSLPEPTLKYSYFVRAVETRVGPQRHKLGLSQAFPWPTTLSAGADAASAMARSAQRQFDARVLSVRRAVADAYWRLWLIKEEHRLKNEHDLVLETLAGTVRGRVRTGAASLADLNQVELGVARHHDHHGQHREARRVARAELLRAIGESAPLDSLSIVDSPREGLPAINTHTLLEAAQRHPRIEALGLMASAAESSARAESGKRWPSILAGVDWIQTDGARAPDVAGSGNDAVIVSAGLRVPIWGRSYRDAARAAEAEATAQRAATEAARQRSNAHVEEALAAVNDAQRRIALYRHTLIPQAETTFRSVLGGYQSGRSTIASALLAQRDLLELQLGLAESRSEHQRAWARLEDIVGRPVAAKAGEEDSP